MMDVSLMADDVARAYVSDELFGNVTLIVISGTKQPILRLLPAHDEITKLLNLQFAYAMR